MTKKETTNAAKQSILSGKTKQETYEALKEKSGISPEDLARIIQGIPSLQARKKYKTLNITLIVLLSLTIVFKLLGGIPMLMENGIMFLPFLFFLPIINILLLWGVATYTSKSHMWVAILAIIGLLRTLTQISGNAFDPMVLVDFAISGAMIGLGFYLNAKLYPSFKPINQTQDELQNVVNFKE